DNRNDLFQPENIDEQIEQLTHIQDQQQLNMTPGAPTISELQRIYKENEEILENAWERIASLANATQTQRSLINDANKHSYQSDNTMQRTGSSARSGALISPFLAATKPRRWRIASMIAATLTILTLIGSMLWVINLAQDKKATSGHTPAKTGAQTTNQPTTSSVLYVGGGKGLTRADASTGKAVWNYTIPGTTISGLTQFIQILPVGNIVYGLQQSYADTPTQIIAFDAAHGQILWTYSSPNTVTMALSGNILYLGVNDLKPGSTKSSLSLLDRSKGTGLSTTFTLNGTDPQLSVIDKTLYVQTTTGLYAFNTSHNQQIWYRSVSQLLPNMNTTLSTFGVAHGTLFVPFIFDSSVYCLALRASDGHELWQTDPVSIISGGSGGGTGITMLAEGNGKIYFASFGKSGTIFAYNEQTGEKAWTKKLNEVVQTPPVFSNNTVYIAEDVIPYVDSSESPMTRLTALDAATGDTKWQTAFKQGTSTSVFALDRVVYVATLADLSSPSFIYAFEASTGKVIWRADLGDDPRVLNVVNTN
ncbi:MAG TPA: PQQ-binding-like beta-propeller repeat protein, partial [Ktedonobacteraceae bacterium]|nr:PQQ-binding-like beta-propeller repeat protein [Ktedonobacteraceae bacterium]